MGRNEIIQWSLVGVVVLLAILWIAVRMIRMAKKSSETHGCSYCPDSVNCKVKELKERAKRAENCHGGQSARN